MRKSYSTDLWPTKGIKLVRLQIYHMEKDQRNAKPYSSRIINPIMFSERNLESSLSHRDSNNTLSWPEKFTFILAGLWVEKMPVLFGSAQMIHLHFEGYVWQGKDENFPLAKRKTNTCSLNSFWSLAATWCTIQKLHNRKSILLSQKKKKKGITFKKNMCIDHR